MAAEWRATINGLHQLTAIVESERERLLYEVENITEVDLDLYKTALADILGSISF